MKELRDFITVVDCASVQESHDNAIIEEAFEDVSLEDTPTLNERLANLVFKLRSHSEPLCESQQGDYSLGVEAGCDMAAEMIENLIRQLGDI